MKKYTYNNDNGISEMIKEYEYRQKMKRVNIIIWLIAGLLTCVAIGCYLGYQNGYIQGVNRAVACASADGVLLHDGKQYFCWYE